MDQMGQKVTINYKGKMSYGTAVGGYVSLCARLVLLTLALGQIWACYFRVKYSENETQTQLSIPNTQTYTVGYGNGFPSFSIYSPVTTSSGSLDEKSASHNNSTMFDFGFILRVADNGGTTKVDAISCKEALNKVADETSRA